LPTESGLLKLSRWLRSEKPPQTYRRTGVRFPAPPPKYVLYPLVTACSGLWVISLSIESWLDTTVTYRCRRRIDVSSTNNTRTGRARRRFATRAEWVLTSRMIRRAPLPCWVASMCEHWGCLRTAAGVLLVLATENLCTQHTDLTGQ